MNPTGTLPRLSARPLVTVVVPTSRRPAMLERAIHSVTAQTYTNWELCVVDDNERGSPDRFRTARCVQMFGNDSQIAHITSGGNRGAGAARNEGIRQARGEVIAFLDDDDEWYPEKLAVQMKALGAAPEGTAAVVTSLISVNVRSGRTQLVEPDLAGALVPRLLAHNPLRTTSTFLCRKDVLEFVGMFDESLPARQDADLYVRIARRYGFIHVACPLVRFNQHAGERISKSADLRLRARTMLLEKHEALFRQWPGAHHYNLKLVGRMHLAASRPRRARALFRLARQVKPWDLSLIAVAQYSRLPSRVRRLVRRVIRSACKAPRSLLGRKRAPHTSDTAELAVPPTSRGHDTSLHSVPSSARRVAPGTSPPDRN